jgi:hypothetical protein
VVFNNSASYFHKKITSFFLKLFNNKIDPRLKYGMEKKKLFKMFRKMGRRVQVVLKLSTTTRSLLVG